MVGSLARWEDGLVIMMQGDELKSIRIGLGLSQAGFADDLGVTATFVGMMERGEKAIEKRTELAALYLSAKATAVSAVDYEFAARSRGYDSVAMASADRSSGEYDKILAIAPLFAEARALALAASRQK